MPSLRILHTLRQGAADLGIVSNAVDTYGLQTLPFCDDPLVLILPAGHALASGAAPRFSDTLAFDYVGLAANSALAVYLEEQALHAGMRLKIRVRAGSFDAVMRRVARGVGLAIVPLATVRRQALDQSLKYFALNEEWARRKLLLCARSFDDLPGYARALLDALRAD